MAGEWIKVRTNLWDDPRVCSLVEATKTSEAAIVGGLYWLWATADEHSTADGILHGMSIFTINRKTGIAGFGEAMVAIGWLTEHPEGVRLARFDEHNGESAKTRAQTAKRVSKHKNKEPANAQVTVAALPEQQSTVSDALPREDKIREELKAEPKTLSEQSPDVESAEPAEDRRKPAKRPASPEDESLAARMFGLILVGNPTARKPNLDAWADDIRLMREVDNRAHPDIWSLFQWVRKDTFWRGNILSPAKLREKWDQLTEKRLAPAARGEPVLNEKFNFNHLDRSGDARAMAASMARHGITTPAADEEIEI